MTPPPAQRTDARSWKVIRRSPARTSAVLVLIYAAWGILSAVAILMFSNALAAPVSWLLPLNQAHASALVITALTLVAGLSAPVAVSRLRARPLRLQARKKQHDQSDLHNH